MTPILIYTPTNANIQEQVRQRSVHIPDLNIILSDYNALGLDTLNGTQFKRLIREPESLIYDIMTGGSPVTVNDLPVFKAEALKLLEKPAGYNELIELIADFRNKRQNWNSLLENIDIISGAVAIAASVVTAITESGKIYLKTDDEKALYDFSQAVIQAAEDNLGNVKHNLDELVRKTIVKTDTEYKINLSSFTGFEN